MNPGLSHPRLQLLDPLAQALVAVIEAAAQAAKSSGRRTRARPDYAALRPGADTPLWNELAHACAGRLTRRGDKAQLARRLGVSRQRLHNLLVEKSSCPDAERTLQLLAWLNTRPATQASA